MGFCTRETPLLDNEVYEFNKGHHIRPTGAHHRPHRLAGLHACMATFEKLKWDLTMASSADSTTIEVHHEGAWTPAATPQILGDDRCRLDYLPDYLFGQKVPQPIAFGMPLDYVPDVFIEGPAGPYVDRRPLPFLYDLVPQGPGRRFLVQQLGTMDRESLMLPLLMRGAFNPIGHLRVASAREFYRSHARANKHETKRHGVSLREILRQPDRFIRCLTSEAMLAAGTTGVQGVAPKFLLATDEEGLWHPDMHVTDQKAIEHWQVKMPRSPSDRDRLVLRNEAAYFRLAAACGLRSIAAPMLHGDLLFVRRFDRARVNGRLLRLHQESLASVNGMRGFGTTVSQQTLLTALRSVVSDPLQETLEFLKRDVLNLAMRNTDNHAQYRHTTPARWGNSVDAAVRLRAHVHGRRDHCQEVSLAQCQRAAIHLERGDRNAASERRGARENCLRPSQIFGLCWPVTNACKRLRCARGRSKSMSEKY